MKERIDKYANGFNLIHASISGLTDDELNYKTTQEEWNIKQIIIHLADSEMVVVYRMKKVISEDRPLLTTMQQELWTKNLCYDELDHNLYLNFFKILRETMVPILYQLKDKDFSRIGIHDELGEITLKDLIIRYIQHIDQHIKQIERLKLAYRNQIQLNKSNNE